MDKADIPFLSAGELSRHIQRKELSPVEVTEAYLERIDDVDFKFNAYLTVCRREALNDAREAESAILRGEYLGPTHGIPVAVKDQFWTKGIRTTGGSRFYADFFPDEDATVVANLRKAGAVILGKTNLTEFAMWGFTHRYSNPRNPWNLDMYTGGSSSGSAAATAAFLCAMSLGEDTGGSIRFPAAWCGLVGLRPGWGRVSRYGVMPGAWSIDQVGPLSRTVEDAAMTLGAIAGYDPKDPYTWNTPVPDYTQALTGDVRGLRVGVITEELHSEVVEPEVRDAVVKAISVLGELGASAEEVSIPSMRYAGAVMGVLFVDAAAYHSDRIRNQLDGFGHANRIGFLTTSVMPAQAYYKAQKLRSLMRQDVLDALAKYDVLVTPTMGAPPQRIVDDPAFTSREATSVLSFFLTQAAALVGVPVISIPCGFSSDNLPIGLQIAGRPGEEETVLRASHAYEQNSPWHTMRPPNA